MVNKSDHPSAGKNKPKPINLIMSRGFLDLNPLSTSSMEGF